MRSGDTWCNCTEGFLMCSHWICLNKPEDISVSGEIELKITEESASCAKLSESNHTHACVHLHRHTWGVTCSTIQTTTQTHTQCVVLSFLCICFECDLTSLNSLLKSTDHTVHFMIDDCSEQIEWSEIRGMTMKRKLAENLYCSGAEAYSYSSISSSLAVWNGTLVPEPPQLTEWSWCRQNGPGTTCF